MDLNGKKILITGGSRGIGKAIVEDFIRRGATVGFSYGKNKGAAEDTLAKLTGEGHFIFPLDITSETSVLEEFEKAIAQLGGTIDGLVNNAGITKDNLLLRMKTADFDDVIQTNLRGTFLCSRAVLKPMMKARKGAIVNISSVIGHSGNAGQANYAASKAGIEAFTRSLAQEMASRNIRANSVAPGFIETEMTDTLNNDQKTNILTAIPLGRIAKPAEVAAAVAFLLSDDASYITGQTLHVNGGMRM